jgi:hypothetical protein
MKVGIFNIMIAFQSLKLMHGLRELQKGTGDFESINRVKEVVSMLSHHDAITGTSYKTAIPGFWKKVKEGH